MTIGTLEQGVKYIHSYRQRQQNDGIGVVLVPLLLTLNILPCSSVSIVNFEHVIAGWVAVSIDFLNSKQTNTVKNMLPLYHLVVSVRKRENLPVGIM